MTDEKLQSNEFNLFEVIGEINKINPSSKIYIIGYYNLLPFVTSNNSEQYKADLGKLNSLLKGISNKNNIEFVETEDLFKDNSVHVTGLGLLLII